MVRKRTRKENQGLPERWRFTRGAFYYAVPPGQEDQWDGEKTFRLGKVYSEALEVFAGRVARGSIHSFNELIDAYIVEILPLKAISTQTTDRQALAILRHYLGKEDVKTFRPGDAVRLEKICLNESPKTTNGVNNNLTDSAPLNIR